MSEENVQATTEAVSESPAKENAQNSSVGQYIAESKRYRERAQAAEAKLESLKQKFQMQEEAKLKEKEDFKTLYEKASSKIEKLTKTADKWNKYEETTRASLIEQHPEDEREYLSTLNLETLEYVTNKINNSKPNAPEVIGRSKAPVQDKSWKDMTEEEKRAYYAYMSTGNKG